MEKTKSRKSCDTVPLTWGLDSIRKGCRGHIRRKVVVRVLDDAVMASTKVISYRSRVSTLAGNGRALRTKVLRVI
jgi:hypothetical protein